MIALSKTLDPVKDYAELAPELAIVDRHFMGASPQHEHRRWEYALALRAQTVWQGVMGQRPRVVYDVGGAGSPFRYMADVEDGSVVVIDPNEPSFSNYTLKEYVTAGAELASNVFCLSVLEHIPADDYEQFLYHLTCLLAPGGLLVLTFDFWDQGERDTAHFHWMRQRIFTRISLNMLQASLATHQLGLFGEIDPTYYGPQVYDYTFASLVLVKRA